MSGIPEPLIEYIFDLVNKNDTSVAPYIIDKTGMSGMPTFIPVGSFSRGESPYSDVDMLTTRPLNTLDDLIRSCFKIKRILSRGAHKFSFMIESPDKTLHRFGYTRDIQIDIFYSRIEDISYALFCYKNSRVANIRARRLAKSCGYKLNQYGLVKMAANVSAECKQKIDAVQREIDNVSFAYAKK